VEILIDWGKGKPPQAGALFGALVLASTLRKWFPGGTHPRYAKAMKAKAEDLKIPVEIYGGPKNDIPQPSRAKATHRCSSSSSASSSGCDAALPGVNADYGAVALISLV
jgi:hypothetical protein